MRTLSIFLIGVAGLFPAIVQSNNAAVVQPGSPVVSKKTVFSFYKSFKRLTPVPIFVPAAFAADCTHFVVSEHAEQERAGPHANVPVNLFVNPQAEKAIGQKLALFPEGVIIVKEKLGKNEAVSAVGGMIKRAAGFDPKNGDWEYFYATQSGGFATGRLENCSACHAKAAAADHVFRVRSLDK